jgi:hypothetical protein
MQDRLQFSQTPPRWSKGVKSILRNTSGVDVVRFIDNDAHDMPLEVLLPNENGKAREMPLARLEELFDCNDE